MLIGEVARRSGVSTRMLRHYDALGLVRPTGRTVGGYREYSAEDIRGIFRQNYAMATAQGADHTAGNLPRLKTREMDLESLLSQSLAHQARVAANDSLGLCIFGMSVTNPNTEWLTNAINSAHGTALTPAFFESLGRDALRLEKEFNRQAGFTEKDDELPAFFYEEALPPTNHVARFHAIAVESVRIAPLTSAGVGSRTKQGSLEPNKEAERIRTLKSSPHWSGWDSPST